MFIQTESMPDPAQMRFLPGRQVLAEGKLDLRNAAEALASPLAARLFAIQGVAGVSLDSDSIIVTKEGNDWRLLKPAILGAIMEHFMSGAPIVVERAVNAVPEDSEDTLAVRVRDALRRVIDPELGYHVVGLGLIYRVEVEEGGVVRVTMTTTTPGCPATSYLLEGVREAAESVPNVRSVDVTLTYEPRWTPEMMSPEAKARLGVRDGGGW